MRPRPLLLASAIGLLGGFLVAAWGLAGPGGSAWLAAHGTLLVTGFILPSTAFLHLHLAHVVGRPEAPEVRVRLLSGLYLASAFGGAAAAVSGLPWAVFAAALVALAAGVLQVVAVLSVVPRRGESVVDTVRDPLTKGDDACFQAVRLAHFLLPAGLALLAAAVTPGLPGPWDARLRLAGLHTLLLGYGAMSLYALGHLVVPRLSGVPAIAAGAIKGQVHSTLAAVTLLVPGFLLFGARGGWDTAFLILGGASAFLGVFTHMGVLGANLMKRKSVTQRVTPEFVYIPWTFAGVFWLVAGILLGLFLNAVPDVFADRLPALRFVHAHALLLGAFTQLWIGWLLRLGPRAAGGTPPTFHRTRWAFYGLNLGLVLLLAGAFRDFGGDRVFLAGGLLLLLAVAGSFMTLRPSLAGRGTTP